MGTPKEIAAIMDAGYMSKLTIDNDNDPSLEFAVIKSRGSKGTKGTCVFHKNGLCQLHDLGLKPIEGRTAMHGKDNPRILYHHLARAWNGKKGKQIIERWQQWERGAK
jgi:hypothetical protein